MRQMIKNRKELWLGFVTIVLMFSTTAVFYFSDYNAANIFFVTFGTLVIGILANIWAGTLTSKGNESKSIIIDVIRNGGTSILIYVIFSYVILYLTLFSPIVDLWFVFVYSVQNVDLSVIKVAYYIVFLIFLFFKGLQLFHIPEAIDKSDLK
jgi:hypothetical protein